MRLLGRIKAQFRHTIAPRHAPRADLGRHGIPRGCNRKQARRRCAVGNDAFEVGRQPQHFAQPFEHALLQLGRRWRCPPQHGVHIERGRKKFAENPRARARDGEIGEERGMVPMRNSRQDQALEIIQNAFDRFGLRRRCPWKLGANLARPAARQNGVAFGMRPVVDDPVDDAMPRAAKLVQIHLSQRGAPRPCALRCHEQSPRCLRAPWQDSTR